MQSLKDWQTPLRVFLQEVVKTCFDRGILGSYSLISLPCPKGHRGSVSCSKENFLQRVAKNIHSLQSLPGER